MSGAFDGTGPGHREPSAKAGLIVILAIVVTVAASALVASWALNHTDLQNPNPLQPSAAESQPF
jgi:hypothetical protein